MIYVWNCQKILQIISLPFKITILSLFYINSKKDKIENVQRYFKNTQNCLKNSKTLHMCLFNLYAKFEMGRLDICLV